MTHFNSFGSNPSLQPFSSGPQTLFSSTVPNAPLQQLPPAMGPQQALPLPPTSSLSTGSNPFRSNTIGPSATTSTSTPLHYNNATLNPSSSNPFRSSTMPITSLMQQQPSSSLLPLPPTSPHNPFATNNNQQISFLNRATTISVASSIPPSTNPFSQQQLSSWK
ncbi:hypothetical protein BDF20DRAFT_891765 [Mycotypha africana]|uniref:uncharacterized protein n=1 Tax=Mycotypha africana TaxID=64632 RepID=UPI0023005F8F|nr:uncharacterized protein BDF20DRAFT_891765 [Mycotypha africana]KAI8968853.1 hypothetical protein BDF20DRAFT_891765 [Mycotypha africana]